ncbi:hypothetical protein SDJN03_17553, partial [Cucurbita argyrosperma subsp. sororia]
MTPKFMANNTMLLPQPAWNVGDFVGSTAPPSTVHRPPSRVSTVGSRCTTSKFNTSGNHRLASLEVGRSGSHGSLILPSSSLEGCVLGGRRCHEAHYSTARQATAFHGPSIKSSNRPRHTRPF